MENSGRFSHVKPAATVSCYSAYSPCFFSLLTPNSCIDSRIFDVTSLHAGGPLFIVSSEVYLISAFFVQSGFERGVDSDSDILLVSGSFLFLSDTPLAVDWALNIK